MTIYYLYVKTHKTSGLKYLGFTGREDPYKYTGSGTRWLNHLHKHGFDFETEILRECATKDEIKEYGIYYSRLWNIVTDRTWANLKEEQGDGGGAGIEGSRKISATMKGRPAHNKGLTQSHKKHKIRADNPITGIAVSRLKGRTRPKLECPHCGRKIDEANFHRYHGDKCKSI
jgi:hypothetical protein